MLSKTLHAFCSQPLINHVCPDHLRYGKDITERFDQHIVDHGLRYGTQAERHFRLKIFTENDEKINKINEKENSFQVGHNQFSTYTKGEF